MEIREENLHNCMQYMRVDKEDAAVNEVRPLYKAAVLYLKNAGVSEPNSDPDLYNLAVWSLTLHYYDHRDSVGSESDIPNGLRPIINQLKIEAEIAHITAQ